MKNIEILEKIQIDNKLSDSQMAGLIGIHRVSWLRIKRTGNIGYQTKEKLIKAFPELLDIFFPSGVTPCQQAITKANECAPSAQGSPIPGGLIERVKKWLQRC